MNLASVKRPPCALSAAPLRAASPRPGSFCRFCGRRLALRPLFEYEIALRQQKRRLRPAPAMSEQSAEKHPDTETLRIWRAANAVCFDVDSTLCVDESIDEFAKFIGCGEAVAKLTTNAMQGGLKFEDALAQRLQLMSPSRQLVQDFVASHPPQYSPGIPELVRRLQSRGTAIFLVSGGFHAIIDPIAQHLGIPAEHVFANTILFKDDRAGSYGGFDPAAFTSRSGGKLAAVQHIKAKHGHKLVVAVGDGATDLEARKEGGADIFIGYGGSVYRPTVAAEADWFVMSIQPLIDALQ